MAMPGVRPQRRVALAQAPAKVRPSVVLPARVKQYAAAMGVAGALCFVGWAAVWPGGLVPDGVAPGGVVVRSALPLILTGLAILALTFPLVLSRSQTITLVPTV